MTVCIAAICERRKVVVGVSDRMITSGGIIQYEPRQAKIISITPLIFLMWAGDANLQAEILPELLDSIQNSPVIPIKVAQVAKSYNEIANKIHNKKEADHLLAPYGLDSESFIGRQDEMKDSFVSRMADEISNFEPIPVEAIIGGVDETGGHIFVSKSGSISCQDVTGFAAIGIGGWHAESQLMHIGVTGMDDAATTVFNCYMAKKRSEIAPGVGTSTDVFFVDDSGHHIFPSALKNDLKKYYEKIIKGEEKTRMMSLGKWNEQVKEAELKAKQEEQTNNDSGQVSTIEKDV